MAIKKQNPSFSYQYVSQEKAFSGPETTVIVVLSSAEWAALGCLRISLAMAVAVPTLFRKS